MGSSSSSSLLDEAQRVYITERAEAELQDFLPYYRKQFLDARFNELEKSLEPTRGPAPKLRTKNPVAGQILYEELGSVLDQNQKWRERYLVVRGGFRLEIHQGLEAFLKGDPPVLVLLPSGGSLWTSLDSYVDQIQRSFPGLGSVKEEFSGFSGTRFLVFLHLPHRPDSAFSFKNQDDRDRFCEVLKDCIRHQNHDFLRRQSLEVKAFLQAVRSYQEDRGRFRLGSLLFGSDVRVMSSLVMERLLQDLQKDPPAGLRTPRVQKTRMWLTFLDEVQVLLDSVLLDRLTRVKQDLRNWIQTLEPSMTTDQDLIRQNRNSIRDQLRARLSAAAEQLFAEKVTPHLNAMLMALLEPISDAFLRGRSISHDIMEDVCQKDEEGGANFKKLIAGMPHANLQSCYQTLTSMSDKLAPYGEVFGFYDELPLMLIDGACLDLQQLVENAAFTFQQILLASEDAEPDFTHKAKRRVLQHFDYDSSIVRKTIIHGALINITRPYVKEKLCGEYKMDLVELQRSVDVDSPPFVVVENEYEGVVMETLTCHLTEALMDPTHLETFRLVPDPVHDKTPELPPGQVLEHGPKPRSEPGSLAPPGQEVECGPNPGLEHEDGPKPREEPEIEPEAGLGVETATESAPKPEPNAKTGQQPGPELEPRAEQEPEARSGSTPGQEQKSGIEIGAEPEPEAGPGAKCRNEPEPSPETGEDPEPKVVPGSKLGQEPEHVPDTCAEPEVPGAGPHLGLEQSNSNDSVAPDCVRAIGELVVLANFSDIIHLDD